MKNSRLNSLSRAEDDRPTLRVLQVFGGLGMGGAETWLISLLRYFNDSETALPFKVKTHICLTSGLRGELDDEAIRLGATLHYIRYSRKNLIGFARQFRKLLADNHFDVIHDHQDYAAGIHFLLGLGRLPSVRIAHVHNPAYRLVEHTTDNLSRAAGAAGKRILNLVGARVAGTSEKLLTEYGFDVDANNPRSAIAVYCGFDVRSYGLNRTECREALRSEFGWDADDRVILFVGRLGGDELATGGRSHKNPMFALEVFMRCFARHRDLRILFAGEKGPMYSVLQKVVDAEGIGDVVRFIGIRPDVPRLMLGSDLLLFPSSAEGLGMVAVEAQASGLRVLASDAVPAECVVDPGLVRFLSLDAGRDAWADAVMDLLNLPQPDQALSNARVESSRFSIATSARELLELYSAGAGKRRRVNR
jgi:glycosyltransferase involved in cell wall biosynthesis